MPKVNTCIRHKLILLIAMVKVLSLLTSEAFYGKERSNIEVYNLLRHNKYDVSVVLNSKADKRIYGALNDFTIYKIDYPNRAISIWRYLIKLIIVNIQLLKILRKVKPDVLFINNETNIYDFFFLINQFRGKIIYRIGDSPYFPILRFRKLNTYIWNKIVIEKVYTIVSISKFIQNQVNETGRSCDRDMVINNYPPERKSQSFVGSSLIQKSKDYIIFGYIGQIMQNKGVDLLVSAANRMTSSGMKAKFIIAGNLNYDKEFGDTVQKLAKKNPNVIFLGEIDDIACFYNTIDVLCVPSVKQEPLGNIIVEAKKYSRPCIIFPSGGMPELISHKIDGFLCESQTEDSLLSGMEYFYSNKNSLENFNKQSNLSIDSLKIDRNNFEKRWTTVFSL